MRYISREEVVERLTHSQCIELMKQLFSQISEGKVTHKLRTAEVLAPGELFGLMPGVLPYAECVGAKAITIFHHNYEKGLPSHQGVVTIFETKTGALKGIVDGSAITAIRTAAVSAMATNLLANKDSKVLALLGAGVQAKNHLAAISLVRDLKKVNIWSIKRDECDRFIEEAKKLYDIKFEVFDSVKTAVKQADIICTVTPAKDPILYGDWLKQGVHINAVGACQPKERELSTDCVVKSKLFGDSTLSVKNEAGDYLYPLKEGAITEEHYLGEIGDVLTGKLSGRTSESDITIFEALGVAVEDLACANWLLT